MKAALGYLYVLFFFAVACSQGAKGQVEKTKDSKMLKLSVVYDTLIFNEEMRGAALKERYALGKKKQKFYKKFIDSGKINQLQKIAEENSKAEIKYLGLLKDLKTKESYHVVTNFTIWGIGQMLSPRGWSEVAFINDVQNNIIVYRLPMPENLPKLIKENILFFQLEKNKLGISILGGLPPQLCLPEIGCN